MVLVVRRFCVCVFFGSVFSVVVFFRVFVFLFVLVAFLLSFCATIIIIAIITITTPPPA